MQFTRLEPPENLNNIVECYWTAVENNSSPAIQKIIPDGFPEIIFHFGNPYRIKLGQRWETQAKSLVAGQITKHFFLENTGASDILGIKLKPAAFARLFKVSMDTLSDQVVELNNSLSGKLYELEQAVRSAENRRGQIEKINRYLREIKLQVTEPEVDRALDSIFTSYGTVTVAQLCGAAKISERQLQRLFKKYVGLSPKFYSRVIRFNHIFQLAQEKKLSWSEVGLEAGFYDQPHFIKNFKAFTGEDPTRYFFDEPTLANFFLKKS